MLALKVALDYLDRRPAERRDASPVTVGMKLIGYTTAGERQGTTALAIVSGRSNVMYMLSETGATLRWR